MRQAFLDAEALEICADVFWERFARLLPFQVGGLEIAAIPLVVALIMKARERGLSVNGFILRKERKPYGVGKVLEGRIGSEPIFLVDDIMNSAETLEKARVLIKVVGRRVEYAFVVIDYKSQRGAAWTDVHGISPYYFFTLSDFGLERGGRHEKPLKRFENVWHFASEKANHLHVVPKSSPLVYEGKVIFGSDRGTMWALDASTGKVRWSFHTVHHRRKGIWSRAASSNGRVYFGSYDGNIYCLDAESGTEIWRNADADWIGSSPALDLESNLLWIGMEHQRPDAQGSLAAFDLAAGSKIWERYLPKYVHGSPAYCKKYQAVAVGTNDHRLYLFDAGTGNLRWIHHTGGGPIKESPLFDESRDLLYVAGFDGLIRAVDVATGDLSWSVATDGAIYSSPLLVNDRLFVTSNDKHLHTIDLALSQHDTLYLGSKSSSTPVEIEGNVFLGTNGGSIIELDGNGGRAVGRHQLPNPVTNRVGYCRDRQIFYGLTYMNELYAFRRAER